MWSVTNYFLLNLTLADVMMATFNTIFSFIYMRDRFYFLFVFVCVFDNFQHHLLLHIHECLMLRIASFFTTLKILDIRLDSNAVSVFAVILVEFDKY